MTEKVVRILLVDDEPELVANLQKRLVRRGFEVVGALRGSEALAHAQQQTFDVAVVDLKMPGMGGLEVLERLAEIQPMLRSVVLTGHGSIDAALESGRRHAVRFLQKPAEFQELLEAIAEADRARRQAQQDAFDREVATLNTSYSSAREIMVETERLRQKYEQ